MDEAVRRFVRFRAEDQCEYCGLSQEAAPFFTFHVEHIRARQHGGTDSPENLALACPDCNAHMGPNLTSADPVTSSIVALFDPRRDPWGDHFDRKGAMIVGLTPSDRATVALLQINSPARLRMRDEIDRSDE